MPLAVGTGKGPFGTVLKKMNAKK